MAFDAFLKIDGIDGESTSQGHEKWIELLSFSWGVSEALAGGGGGGVATGRVTPQAFSFMKVVDSASPKLFLKLTQGAHFQKVSLACRAAGAPSVDGTVAPADDFLKIDFSDVIFSSQNEGGNTATDQRPLESLSFAFAKIEFQVAPTLADGTLGDFSTGALSFLKANAAD